MYGLYIVKTDANQMYIGIAKDPKKRFAKHCSGKGAKYLKGKTGLELAFHCEPFMKCGDAMVVEKHLKNMSRKRKDKILESLKCGDETVASLLAAAPRDKIHAKLVEGWQRAKERRMAKKMKESTKPKVSKKTKPIVTTPKIRNTIQLKLTEMLQRK